MGIDAQSILPNPTVPPRPEPALPATMPASYREKIVIVVIAIVSDDIAAPALIARWASTQDHAEIRPGRNAAPSLLARAALRALLARHTGRSDWQIVRNALGKPFAIAPTGAPGPAISLSHTAAMAAVALADIGALGIDIERHRPRDFAALAAQAFGPAEQAAVAASGAEAFYRIWTLREAVAKATGEGLALAANGRDLVQGGACEPYRRIAHAGRAWHLAHVPIAPDCSLAVAHADAPDAVWALRWSELGARL